jgi:diguanylate cyclase (GGDEF)-like protein
MQKLPQKILNLPEDVYACVASLIVFGILMGLIYGPLPIKIFLSTLLSIMIGLFLNSHIRLRRKYKEENYKNATTDSLTNVYNINYFSEIAAREMNACMRHRDTLSVMVFMINNYEAIKKDHGQHLVDQALASLCSHIKEKTRAVDVFARISDEEFVILCPDAQPHEMDVLKERIDIITKSVVVTDVETHEKVSFDCSIGVTQYSPETDRQFDDMLSRAENELNIQDLT